MNQPSTHETLYRLIRNYIEAMGASRTTLIALKAYIDAVKQLQCADEDFQRLLLSLNSVLRNTEPKVIPLLHLIEEFEAEMAPFSGGDLQAAKARAIEILEKKQRRFESDTENLTRHCMEHIQPSDFIITHSPTAYIREGFIQAHSRMQGQFKILVLKQEFLRTRELIRAFEQYQIGHLVIPEYDLSHYLDAVTKLFIGAVSISSDGKVITGVGTSNVVSLCHAYHVPVYLFAESLKFAHTPLPEQRIYREQKDKLESDFTFHMTTFSHDMVDLAMIDHVVTEEGDRSA
jgi:translation initiation factor 2B subunit (eIF-2B alpha/beta/delta family)